MLFEQPRRIVAEPVAQRAVLEHLVVEHAVGLVKVARRRCLETEGYAALCSHGSPLPGRSSWRPSRSAAAFLSGRVDRGSGHGKTARSEEHTSELQSLMRISYAVFCLKKKK